MDCAHLDGDPHNNAASNLKWVTKRENEFHKIAHGTSIRGERCHNAKLTEDEVRDIRYLLSDDPPRGMGSELARKYGVNKCTISAIKKGRLWAHCLT